MQHDPLNDALVLIKNAERSGRSECILRPASKLLGNILGVMKEYDYIGPFEYIEDMRGGKYRIKLIGMINNCGVIKPRYSMRMDEMEKFESRYLPAQDFGVLIITTTKGVVSHIKAREMGVGGKLLAYVY